VFLSKELDVAVQSGASSYFLVSRAVTDFTAVTVLKAAKLTVQCTVRQTKHCNENAVTLFAYGAEERCVPGFGRET